MNKSQPQRRYPKVTDDDGNTVTHEGDAPWCMECRAGEHDNYDDNVRMVTVRDPETKKLLKRGYVCSEHAHALECDGYDLVWR